MNQELGAQAFTNGADIYFNSGKYNPQINSGKHLIAHELTHVVQQSKDGLNHSNSAQGKEVNKAFTKINSNAKTNMVQLKDLVYAGGYPRPFRNNRQEINCVTNNECKWSPATIDFRATAQNSGGGDGISEFKDLLKFIEEKTS